MMIGIMAAVFIAAMIFCASNMLVEKPNYGQALAVGAIAGAISYFSDNGGVAMSVISLAAIAAVFGLMGYSWHKEGSNFKEMLPFIGMVLVFYFVGKAAMAPTTVIGVIAGALLAIMSISLIAFMVIDLCLYWQNVDGDNRYRYLLFAIAIIAILLAGYVVADAANDVKDVNTATEQAQPVTKPVESVPETSSWYHFFNEEVRMDMDQKNDYNFGPNPYTDGENVDYYVNDFANRRTKDPALLSATALALDSVAGTDYIGEVLYMGYDEKLNALERADAATQVFVGDKSIFDSANEAISAMLSSAKDVQLVREDKISDQLYMNGYSVSGVPQVVIYETDVTSDWCLVYTFQVKTSEVQIAFRIPCGYQWTNPYEVLSKPVKVKTVTPKKVTTPKKKENKEKEGVVKIIKKKEKWSDPPVTPVPKPVPIPDPPKEEVEEDYVKDSAKDPVSNTNANTYGGKNKADNGVGDDQVTKPSKSSGSNAGPTSTKKNSSSQTSSGKGSSPAASGGSGKTEPIKQHEDSHDNENQNAGNENGEFTM